jgi:TRAP-type transport system small permease protein
MNKPERYVRLRFVSGRALTLFAAVTLFVIMWITVVDVVARDVFNTSIVGLFEVTEILMGVLVFSGVPIITANDGHVSVTLLDSWVGPKLRIIQKILVNILCVTVLVVLAWRLWHVAERAASYNDVTLFLKAPLAPVAYFMAIMTAVSVPILVALTFLPDRSKNEPSSGDI